MNIKAAMYGWGQLDFLADSTTEEDIDGLIKLMADAKGDAKKSEKNGSVEFELTNSAGRILVSSNINRVSGRIKIAMLPYQRRLAQPDYVVAEIRGQEPIVQMLESKSFPIIVPEDSQLKEFEKRFPRYCARLQSGYEIQMSIELLKEAVPELI